MDFYGEMIDGSTVLNGMHKGEQFAQRQVLLRASQLFKVLAAGVNECFIHIHFVPPGEFNRAVTEDIDKIDSAYGPDGEETNIRKFYGVLVYYERLKSLMETLIVAEEEQFDVMASVCSHFGIPERIVMRQLVNYTDLTFFNVLGEIKKQLALCEKKQ